MTREDWTCEVVNMSGLRQVRASTSPSGWLLKKVTLNGADITDQPNRVEGVPAALNDLTTKATKVTKTSG